MMQIIAGYSPFIHELGKIFSENNGKRITSIDFDADGTHCITASEDESLNLYDVLRGE
jgi:WD40 repeat protein